MLTFERATIVSAPPERVYDILVDLAGHRTWKPFFQLSGAVDPGDDVMVNFRFRRGRPIATPATIVAAERPHRFAWRFGMTWIFAVEESYTLAATDGGTHIAHRLRLMGLIAPLPALIVGHTLRRSIAQSDACLVERVQRRRPTGSAPAAPGRPRGLPVPRRMRR